MKVEFTSDEIHTMLEAIIEEVAALKMDKHDRAAIRRWLADDMTPGSLPVQRLTEKLNDELQQTHARSEVSAIKKPDWL
jgi:YesN/AraC family two-component response regulator